MTPTTLRQNQSYYSRLQQIWIRGPDLFTAHRDETVKRAFMTKLPSLADL
jgi:hypothetical protein